MLSAVVGSHPNKYFGDALSVINQWIHSLKTNMIFLMKLIVIRLIFVRIEPYSYSYFDEMLVNCNALSELIVLKYTYVVVTIQLRRNLYTRK